MKKLMLVMALLAVILSSSTMAARIGTQINQHIGDGAPDHWTLAGSPYYLVGDIMVKPNETLTIDAGVVIATYIEDDGSLAVSRDAKIYVNGTAANPVVFTSAEDVATWDGSVVVRTGTPETGYPSGWVTEITTMGDSKTGTWRAACNEWGSLAIMGNGYISSTVNSTASAVATYPHADNDDVMEGLQADASQGITGDMIRYGGGNDDDDSGVIQYVSFRYGGREIALANELNGLSLGGVGRGTDVHHVEIMNNLDDGIEIWGGTVELDHVSIWNIGDDSFDLDQGWRGKASYGLIVQGYCDENGSQGSGQGDNCFEHDGAEDSDSQPVTTATISNFTAIGDPYIGDQGSAWRANCRIQYDDCIWTDIGDKLIKNDNLDGDGSQGYGHNGTLTWAQTWATSYDAAWDTSNSATGGHSALSGSGLDSAALQTIYAAQTSGYLAQVTDSVFHNIASYGEAVTVGALADTATLDAPNGTMGNIIKSASPLQEVTRGPITPIAYAPVTYLNPLPVDGVVAGGFSNINWLASWTATDAYGMIDTSMNAANGDVNVDGSVDLADFMVMSNNWLQ